MTKNKVFPAFVDDPEQGGGGGDADPQMGSEEERRGFFASFANSFSSRRPLANGHSEAVPPVEQAVATVKQLEYGGGAGRSFSKGRSGNLENGNRVSGGLVSQGHSGVTPSGPSMLKRTATQQALSRSRSTIKVCVCPVCLGRGCSQCHASSCALYELLRFVCRQH